MRFITAIADFFLEAAGVAVTFFIINVVLPRRTSGILAGYDFVSLWLFGGLAAAPLLYSKVSFGQAVSAMVAVLICHFAISRLAVQCSVVSRLITGKPAILVESGKVLRRNMRRALVPSWMLMAELRCAGLSDLSQVDYAILESCGRISIIPKPDLWPVTAGDLNMQVSPTTQPSILIEDGNIIEKNLKRLNYDVNWLQNELSKQGVARLEEIYVASIDGSGNLSVSYKE